MNRVRRPFAVAFAGLILAAPAKAASDQPSDHPAPGQPAAGQKAPANTLRELFHALGQCLSAEGGAPGSEITLVFSLRRDGALIGKPRIAYSKLPKDAAAKRRFVDGVAASFDRCIPVKITDALGGAIAGRPLSMHIGFKGREIDI